MVPTPHAAATRRWCFADQLGPHFLDHDNQSVLQVESTRVFARRRFHRQKAHLVLSALRHRAAELGERARFVQASTYREAIDAIDEPLSVCGPTSRGAERLVHTLDVEVLPARGFVTSREDFAAWAAGRRGRLLMEDFYRETRRRLGVLMDGNEPAGGRWNYDADNREPPPKRSEPLGVSEPWWPAEDDIDAEVRADLDQMERDGHASFVGRDGPRRFAATRAEALTALDAFIEGRLAGFGPH